MRNPFGRKECDQRKKQGIEMIGRLLEEFNRYDARVAKYRESEKALVNLIATLSEASCGKVEAQRNLLSHYLTSFIEIGLSVSNVNLYNQLLDYEATIAIRPSLEKKIEDMNAYHSYVTARMNDASGKIRENLHAQALESFQRWCFGPSTFG